MSFEDKRYTELHAKFSEQVVKLGRALEGGCPVKIRDFLGDHLSKEEQRFLNKLEHGGSIIDTMKTHAIIHNKGVKHLQLDANTKFKSYGDLYAETFNKEDEGMGGINASVYPRNYIAAHNKVVYTVPGGGLAEHLASTYYEFI